MSGAAVVMLSHGASATSVQRQRTASPHDGTCTQTRPPFTMNLVDAKTKLLIAVIVLVGLAGLGLSVLVAFSGPPAN